MAQHRSYFILKHRLFDDFYRVWVVDYNENYNNITEVRSWTIVDDDIKGCTPWSKPEWAREGYIRDLRSKYVEDHNVSIYDIVSTKALNTLMERG